MDSHVQQMASESKSFLKTIRVMRKMTSNTFSNKKTFLNIPPLFNGDRFDIWKSIIKISIENINLELW